MMNAFNVPIVLHLGKYRKFHSKDSEQAFLNCLESLGVCIKLILVPFQDSSIEILSERWNVLELPKLLSGKKLEIENQKSMHMEFLEKTRDAIMKSEAQVGFIYYGGYFPDILVSACPRGFLNFHPCPLPQLKGFECNTFAILQGFRKLTASVHQLSDQYDAGALLAHSKGIYLNAYHTPTDVLQLMDPSAPQLFVDAMNRCFRNECESLSIAGSGFHATREAFLKESWIDVHASHLAVLWRKFRAFSGQRAGVRLKTYWSGVPHFVDDLVLLEQKNGAKLNSIPGEFRDYHRMDCLDGAVLVRMSSPAPLQESFFEGVPPVLMNRELLMERDIVGLGKGDSW